jgi:uncharacterized protein (DUF1501 family)
MKQSFGGPIMPRQSGFSRRQFVAGCCGAALAGGSRLLSISFAADAAQARSRDLLVAIFLRGGMDGLNFVAPVNDPHYVAARSAALRLSDKGDSAALPLGNGPAGLDFRIHPSAKSLKELYDSKQLAIVHACGLTNGTRSHFEAQDLMDRGVVDLARQNIGTGWLTRHLQSTGAGGLLPAIGTSDSLPNSLLGFDSAAAVPDPNAFSFYGDESQLAALRSLYRGDSLAARGGAATLEALRVVSSHLKRDKDGNLLPYQPENGAQYPGNASLASSLQTVARLAKMDVGLQCAAIDVDGWDTHQNQSGTFPGLIEQVSGALAVFYNDMSRWHDRLSVVVMSEFGRRLKSNESDGTDHGHGNLMLCLGGNVNGGQIHGRWPGLATEQLDDRADLAVTTDYRAVLAELLARRVGDAAIASVFPGLKKYQPLGVFRGAEPDGLTPGSALS